MLSVRALEVHYDGVSALKGTSLEVGRNEIVAVIGPNGSGKSSLLRAIAGLVDYEGDVQLAGQSLRGLRTDQIVAHGLSFVPETRQLFAAMTCEDNLRAGLYLSNFRGGFRRRAARVFELFPRLADRLAQAAGTLSGGEQQMLAIGRALMQDPKMLLLDEPSIGLSPGLTQELFRKIGEVRETGCSVLLVEQKARLALALADRGCVLSLGQIVRQGEARALAEDPGVQRLYFGAPASRPSD